jgi:hypothetical protein
MARVRILWKTALATRVHLRYGEVLDRATGRRNFEASNFEASLEQITMDERRHNSSENIVPFAPALRDDVPKDRDPMDSAGQAIMGLIQEAATTAKDNCGRALSVAHGLSIQLRAAEDRINELETELRYFQERTLTAENWLQRISREIENRFFDTKDGGQVRPDNRQAQPKGIRRI